MLSCKDFVRYQGEILEGEELSLGKRMSLKMHYFMCHHCRRYFKQIRLVDAVANKLQAEPVAEQKVEELLEKVETEHKDKDQN